jgi:hypothetical protein
VKEAGLFLLVALSLVSTRPAFAADNPPASPEPSGRALIVVGLPGDDEHEALFHRTARRWRDWLTGPLRFPADGVRILFGKSPKDDLGSGPATREAIKEEVEALKKALRPDDRLWVFVLGHANEDEGHAFLHLPGPDLRDDEFAALFRGLGCREQVFWLTTAASGWFVPPLAAKGRIVVAATERDKEFNETEFPHALADVSALPSARLDVDGDGRVSVWELFVRAVEAVQARFAEDKRAPTEHAQLDDDGDGLGVEAPDPSAAKPDAPKANDGALAKKTFLPTNPS